MTLRTAADDKRGRLFILEHRIHELNRLRALRELTPEEIRESWRLAEDAARLRQELLSA